MDVKTANPMVLARLKKQDPMKRRGRAYGLGERNPATLPGSGTDAESVMENAEGTKRWTKLGKLARAGKLIGNKYV